MTITLTLTNFIQWSLLGVAASIGLLLGYAAGYRTHRAKFRGSYLALDLLRREKPYIHKWLRRRVAEKQYGKPYEAFSKEEKACTEEEFFATEEREMQDYDNS